MSAVPGSKQVWVEGDIHRQIKVQAAEAGCDIQDVVNNVLRAHVEKTKTGETSSEQAQESALKN